jgi:hypothetical protein
LDDNSGQRQTSIRSWPVHPIDNANRADGLNQGGPRGNKSLFCVDVDDNKGSYEYLPWLTQEAKPLKLNRLNEFRCKMLKKKGDSKTQVSLWKLLKTNVEKMSAFGSE